MKIDVVGAGPAGNYVAFLLAKQGHKVTVYERNQEIGKPVQCTGILSDYFSKILIPNKEYILNTINAARIHSPNGKFLKTRLKNNYIICRKKFDNQLANKARIAGAKFLLGHSLKTIKQNQCTYSFGGKVVVSNPDIIIGADGPNSTVAKQAGIIGNRVFVTGTQIEVEKTNDNTVDFFPYLGCYAWMVPTNRNTMRVGVVAYDKTTSLYKRFIKAQLGTKFKVIENQSGIIPVFNPRVKVQKNNVFLVGDAATFVKATTGGGINQSLVSATILANCIKKGKSYGLTWKKTLFPKLYFHLVTHRILQRFSDKDWNELIDTFNGSEMKKTLYKTSRDNILELLLQVLKTKPSLIKYARYIRPKDVL